MTNTSIGLFDMVGHNFKTMKCTLDVYRVNLGVLKSVVVYWCQKDQDLSLKWLEIGGCLLYNEYYWY